MIIQQSKFLTAEWRKLILANYPVDPELLLPYLPEGTELDFFEDNCYISLIGFMFLNTKLLGVPVPFHTNFEEVNLRFYVKRKTSEGWKRGVVFIKEIVPKFAIAYTARTIYREPYVTMPMKNEIMSAENNLHVGYYFQHKNFWNKISVNADPTPIAMTEGSIEEYITEHYWGYNRFSGSSTIEYEVEHPRWKVYPVKNYSIQVRYKELYGEKFAAVLQTLPLSVILAEGSEICVRKMNKLAL